MLALEFQEAVVPALLAIGKLAADIRAGFVNGAATVFFVQKLTRRLVDIVGAMAQNLLPHMLIRFALGEYIFAGVRCLGLGRRNPKILSQPVDIFFADHDARVGAAVAGAFAAVVTYFCFCHSWDSIASVGIRGMATTKKPFETKP